MDTPTEIQIGAILAELESVGLVEPEGETLQERADWFERWTFELIHRRWHEHHQDTELNAAWHRLADEAGLNEHGNGDWYYTNHTGGAGVTFGEGEL